MRLVSVWARMLKLERTTVVENVTFDEELNAIVVHVRPNKRAKQRCGECGRRCPWYDRGEGAAAGGRWTWDRYGRTWRRRRPGCAALSTG